MQKNSRIYINRRFFIGNPFKGYDLGIEIISLKYMLERMLAEGRFEVAAIIRNRLDKIEQQLITQQSWCILMEIRYSLS
jgi:hypothetical protein